MSDIAYTIFYADDDMDDQQIFKEIISEIDRKDIVLTLNNGNEVLNILKAGTCIPHLIFLDINMPVKNGFDVLKEIKSDENLRSISIIILSTSRNENSILQAKELGAALYIVKPSNYYWYKKMLRSVLSIDWIDNSIPFKVVF
jgi:CheY-like chemotaxis protein